MLNFQPGSYLSKELELCSRQNAHYYIAQDFVEGGKVQTTLAGKSRQTLFFRVQYVVDGRLSAERPYLFLKVSCTPSYENEAKMHRDIDNACRQCTPNIITAHHVKLIEADRRSIQLFLLEFGSPLRHHLAMILRTTPDELVVLSCFFQVLHAVATLHYKGFQHRDIHADNFVSAYYTRTVSQHYLIDGVHFSLPLRFGALTMAPMLLDFGLAEPATSDSKLNNIEQSLPPDFIFFNRTLSYTNSDEMFSTGLTLVTLSGLFKLPPLDTGILSHIQSLFVEQMESASECVFDHLQVRNFVRLAEHAFRLVLLLGFPSQSEFPIFFASPVGRYLYGQISNYVYEMPEYNFLARQESASMQVARSLLRWRRVDRLSGKEALLQAEFSVFRTTVSERCLDKPHFEWQLNV